MELYSSPLFTTFFPKRSKYHINQPIFWYYRTQCAYTFAPSILTNTLAVKSANIFIKLSYRFRVSSSGYYLREIFNYGVKNSEEN